MPLTAEDFFDQYMVGPLAGTGSFPQTIKLTDNDWRRLAKLFPQYVTVPAGANPPSIQFTGLGIYPTTQTGSGRAALLDLSGGGDLL